MDNNELFGFAKEAVLGAANELITSREELKNADLEVNKDIKLKADKASEKILMNKLKETDLSILSEEYGLLGENTGGKIWIIDPLDGSMNYSRGFPMCCVSVALWEDKKPVFGIIYDLSRADMYSGMIGVGAWKNENPVFTSKTEDISKAVLCTGFPVYMDYSEEFLKGFIGQVQSFKKIRMIGSAALSLAFVGAGYADVYFERNIKLWDIAAGLAIIQAAGGECEMVEINGEYGFDVRASNKILLSKNF